MISGLLTAVCVPSAMLFGPAGLVLYRLYGQPLSAASAASEALTSIRTDSKLLLLSGVVLGIGLLCAVVAQTTHNIIFDTNYTGPYFCEQVAGG